MARPLRTYGTAGRHIGAKGIAIRGAALTAIAGAALYASGNLHPPKINVPVPFLDQRTTYQITADEYQKLTGPEQLQFVHYEFSQMPSSEKAQIVGEDLGIKVSDLYRLQATSTPSAQNGLPAKLP